MDTPAQNGNLYKNCLSSSYGIYVQKPADNNNHAIQITDSTEPLALCLLAIHTNFSVPILMSLIEIIKQENFKFASQHSPVASPDTQKLVSDIIRRVINDKDQAIIDMTREFDKVSPEHLRVPDKAISDAEATMDSVTKSILSEAIESIRAFHKNQIQESWTRTANDGTRLGEIVTPLDRVGVYVPGGTAFYPSSMIMNAVPAQLADVPSIVVASPPGANGLPHQLVLGICSMLGIDEVYAFGGAQAVAALAYGTDSIQAVCKITGPGNKYVAEAKRQVYGQVGIDSIAGPSEILILHDVPDVPIEFLVRDMISQAEHDEEATSILITTIPEVAQAVQKRLDELVPTLPRKDIIEASLKHNGKIILVDTIDRGIEISNRIAPEHLELLLADESQIEQITNAGAIFMGPCSSEPVGDYMAGPNHTIPTSGAAKFSSPLSVRDFQKHSSLIHYSKKRLLAQGENIAKFADMEELSGHAAAIRVRLK